MLGLVATHRGTLKNVRHEIGEREGRAIPCGELLAKKGGLTLRDSVGHTLHASFTISAEDDLGRERLSRYGLRPPFSLSRLRVLRDGRISYQVKKSSRRISRCRLMTPVECIARLCALVPPPRYPLTRSRGNPTPKNETASPRETEQDRARPSKYI
jgi:hypothetical protein